jgi:ABC-type sugar transport system substrate-binding protein
MPGVSKCLTRAEDSEALTAENQRSLLREAMDKLAAYGGLIIAPFDTESLWEDLADLRVRYPDFPVVTVDKDYNPQDKRFKARGVSPPPGCVCDGRYGGALAADCILEYLIQTEAVTPNVVVIQGLEGSLPRVKGFRERIREYNSSAAPGRRVHVSVSRPIPFRQAPAGEEAEKYLLGSNSAVYNDHRFSDSSPRQGFGQVDAFFCCNDEIALGVRDRLDRMFDGEKRLLPTAVVGFDGIGAVKKRIREKDLWLINTIDVKLSTQVMKVVALFERASRGLSRVTVKTTKGRVVARIDRQPEHSDEGLSQRDHVAYILAERQRQDVLVI